ncbi:unnamed protein product [Lupinus luteus]|uniref:Cellulose synthase n=1 Tax=Lupinus luteus TaxID=3873 RepID=A0AAV1YLD1_LUPLU
MMESEVHFCNSCGEQVGVDANGEVFVACHVCYYPICKACVDYEISEDRKFCLRCCTPYEDNRAKDNGDTKVSENRSTMAAQISNSQEVGSLHARHALNVSEASRELNDESGNPIWKNRVENWKEKDKKNKKEEGAKIEVPTIPPAQKMEEIQPSEADAAEPLSVIVPIAKTKLSQYRFVIITRLIILSLFFHYRITHPVDNAFGMWLTSIICEIWFACSWVLDQFPKWYPINRETFIDKLSARYFQSYKNLVVLVFLGHSGAHDMEGNELPRLVYVSREKRPGYQHHKKAGAENALVRVSAVLTNAPYILNLDCDHYVNNSKAVREAMCFLMDPQVGRDVCYVQFPQRFDGIDRSDRYANRNTVFFDVNMKGLDGIQGPVYVGTGCVFNRQALYGYSPPSMPNLPRSSSCCCCPSKKPSKDVSELYKDAKREELDAAIFNLREIDNYDEYERSMLISQMSFEKTFGLSTVFIESTLMENGGVPESANPSMLIKEAIHVISCAYEEKTEWGKEIGWIYGSVTEDILTGFKMQCRGWRSIYCMPLRPAFKGSAPINLSDRLHQVLRWALGSVEIFLSRHCPLWYGFAGGRLKWLQRLAYINTIVYPFTSLPLVAYCSLPAICLLTGKFIIPTLSNLASALFLGLFISIIVTSVLEMRWSGVTIEELWRNEQFWVIGGVSAHLFAVFQGFLKMLAGVDTNFTVTAKASDDAEFGELYIIKWTTLLIPPTTLIIVNMVGVVAGFSDALNGGYESWGPLIGKVFFAFWVVIHLYPFLKGLMGRQNRTPTIVVVWSVLLASVFSLVWVKINPFVTRVDSATIAQTCISIDC